MLKHLLIASLAFIAVTTTANAVVYLTIGGNASQNNVPLSTYNSIAGSGSIAIDLGRYVRLGYTHRQEYQSTQGWTKEDNNAQYIDFYNLTHLTSNSVDLTVILYEGELLVPYIVGGGVIKTYRFENRKAGITEKSDPLTMPPVPNLGTGVGLRLNRDFTLKLSYVASPGYTQEPNGEIKGTWDKYSTLQLTYQL